MPAPLRALYLGDAEPGIAAALRAEPCQLARANSLEGVLAVLAAETPDALVLDFAAGGDAAAACRRVREAGLPASPWLPLVVALPADADGLALEVRAAGADDVLDRPADRAQVAAVMASLLRRRIITRDLERAENVVFALATAIEQKDDYTEGHGERVALFASRLAEHVGLGEAELKAVYTGGILHDIGKIGCPDAILNKPGPLTPNEFEVVKRHPVQGWEICRHLTSLEPAVLGCIRHHHERLDGTGYPDGLTSDEIRRTTRIMSIADVFDALATARAYKPAFPTETCLKILREESERGWWDGELVDAFADLIASGGLKRKGGNGG